MLFFGLAVPNLPCQVPGGDSCPPDDDAEQLVPDAALAYLHANLDPETEQYELAAEIAGRVPVFSGQIAVRALAQVPGAGGGPARLRARHPALVRRRGRGRRDRRCRRRAEQVELFEVSDAEGATEFATAIAAGRRRVEDYQGVEITVDGRGLATAQVEGFLAIGPADGVRAVIDTATGAATAPRLPTTRARSSCATSSPTTG